MLDRLKKDVWKRFGPTYGSQGLREARAALRAQCEKRYFDARRLPDADPETALQAALPTAEEVEAARAPHVRPGMARAYYCRLCILLTLVSIPLLYAGIACVRSYMAGGPVLFSLLVFIGAAVPVWLIAQGILWLKRSGNAAPWIMIPIGVLLLLIVYLFIFVIVDTGRFYHYDHTDRLDQVASIDLVRLDKVPKQSSEGDCLEYTVIETAAPERYGSLLKDLAGLRYWFHWFGDPPWLGQGSEIILIRFSPDQDGMLYAFYGRWYPGHVLQTGTTQEMTYHLCPCSNEQWDELVARYFPGAPLR